MWAWNSILNSISKTFPQITGTAITIFYSRISIVVSFFHSTGVWDISCHADNTLMSVLYKPLRVAFLSPVKSLQVFFINSLLPPVALLYIEGSHCHIINKLSKKVCGKIFVCLTITGNFNTLNIWPKKS